MRGPASAVWGANALTGVVNIITKTPREAAGRQRRALTGGLFDRDARLARRRGQRHRPAAPASALPARPTTAGRTALAGGYFNSDPYSRPTGTDPVIPRPALDHAVCNTGTAAAPPYVRGAADSRSTATARAPGTAFENSGTSQPKVDLRVDQDFTSGGAHDLLRPATPGPRASSTPGIGPFDLQSGSYMGYGRVGYSKGALRIGGLRELAGRGGAEPAAARTPPRCQPVQLNFKTQTFDFEVGHSTVLAGKHILSYGGNARRNNFDITLTPDAEDRNEFGAYFQ